MQKTIIIALLVASAICVQVNVGPFAVPTAGYAVTMGVIQKCDRSCLTCSGPLATNCLTCVAGLALSATKTCGCGAAEFITGLAGAAKCEANTTASAGGTASAGTATLALCEGITTTNMWYDSTNKQCAFCGATAKKCATTADAPAANGTCWGGLTASGTATCPYDATKTRLVGVDTVHAQGTTTTSLINGYFYTAGTSFVQEPCAAGCLTCDAAGGATGALGNCLTCATGFALNTATLKRCECPTAGFFHTTSTTAFDTCTACATGAATCTSLTVDVTCTDTSHSANVDSTDSSIVKCGAKVVATSSTDSSASSTDGESSATTTSATDAASTSGVLITAASMLLAVILA